MPNIIGGKSCRSCEHSFEGKSDKLWYCAFNPPVPFMVPTRGQNGQMQPGFISTYPPIDPSLPCAKYQRSELKAQAEIRGVAQIANSAAARSYG